MYWILLIFLAVGFVYPMIGIIAIICMIGPVAMAFARGRRWCGHICPRGNFYDRVMRRVSRRRPAPEFFRRWWFRYLMIAFIFLMFGFQMSRAWGDAAAMGNVFVQIIFVTTLAGVILALLYHERTWCGFCPMGSLSALVAPKQKTLENRNFQAIFIGDACINCKRCGKVCPMRLQPYEAGKNGCFIHGDCLKCGECIKACPKNALTMR